MPARKAPSTSDRPARPVRNASSRMMSSTLSTKSSVDPRRATAPSQPRISRGPTSTTKASASAALASAADTSMPSAPAGCASAGIRTRSGTTARSWKSSTPTVCRPCGESSAPRSASMREAMAVEDIAAMPPSARPACHDSPNRNAPAMAISTVQATCAPPTPNIERSLLRLNSSPMENMRNTTPNSARCCVSSRFETKPAACGPSARPVTR